MALLASSCDVKNPNYDSAVGSWRSTVVEFAKNGALVEIAQEIGAGRKSLDIRAINLLDLRWRRVEEGHRFIEENTSQAASEIMLTFQALHPQFVEVFATDAIGLNIGLTNRTTDFYQADEEWWQKSFKFNGDAFSGEIEFDVSSQNWVVPIYVPIRDEKGRAIGVVKALLNSAAIYSKPTAPLASQPRI
jgi:hypothetical protein